MNEEELIKKLEETEIPMMELVGHRQALKMALLRHEIEKEKETKSMEINKPQTTEKLSFHPDWLFPRQSSWRKALTALLLLALILTSVFGIPKATSIVKSTFFPEGKQTITGPQLTDEERAKAMDILMSSPEVTLLLKQGAAIDKILPIYVTAQMIDSETGAVESVQETWAQAWLVRGSQDWGVQIDLVQGKVVSINPSVSEN